MHPDGDRCNPKGTEWLNSVTFHLLFIDSLKSWYLAIRIINFVINAKYVMNLANFQN